VSNYESKWIKQIIGLQHEDGSWGYFHTLSRPANTRSITTEQALRRLRILGLTKDDEPINKALNYMRGILLGKIQPPDRREKVLNWDAFEAHMTAAWIRLFAPNDGLALPVARMWAEIVTLSFANGTFDADIYAAEYRKRVPALNKGERLITSPQFYMVNLLKGLLDKDTESHFVDYIINNPGGIYYVNNSKITDLPTVFPSRQTGFYLAALEQLAEYSRAGEKLRFAVDWLLAHRDNHGEWDLGASAKDGVYLPLSDSWRKPESRRRDCTVRIEKLLKALEFYVNIQFGI
jgi:integrase